MRRDKFFGGYLLVATIGVVAALLGFLLGILMNIPTYSMCTNTVQDRIVVEKVNVTDLDVCLELIKESDMFQRQLYNKSWMR